MSQFGGVSTAATGTITSGTASLLTFAKTKQHVVITNISAVRVYLKLNDPAGALLVSATVWDMVLDAGDSAVKTIIADDVDISTIGVFMAATSGLRAVGWSSSGV